MNLRQISAMAIVLFLVCIATAEAKYRTWTDAQDRTVTAEFVRINNGNVVLKQNNGKVISVPFYSLSDDDQEFVRELLEAKGQGSQVPRKRPSGFDLSTQKNAPGVPLGAGNMPLGANAAGANAGGAAPPLGGPGRMPPGMNAAGGHQAGAPFPGGPLTPPGTTPNGGTLTPPGMPGAPLGSNPAGVNPAGTPGSYPGAGMMPGMNPRSGTTPMPGTNGPGMPPLGSTYPQNNSSPPAGPIGVSPVTPGMGGPGVPQMQWVETKTCEKCKKEVPSTSKAGDHCPHCGTYWGYETGQNGTKTYAVGYRAGKVIGGIIFLLALVGTGIKKLMSR